MYYLTSASFKVRRWPNLALSAPAALAPLDSKAATRSISTWFRSEISLHLRVLQRPVQRQHSALSAAISLKLSLCICFKWSEQTSQFSLVQRREKAPVANPLPLTSAPSPRR